MILIVIKAGVDMGRRPKIIASFEEEDRRESGYYATPKFVADFLARRMLDLCPEAKTVLDPCVGRGELIGTFGEAGLHVTGYDIIDRSPVGCAKFEVADFLEIVGASEGLSLFHDVKRPSFDLVVANPPYNCHETDYIRKNKVKLVERFGKATALNMYSLFVRAIIEYATDSAVIGLVTHDSFLTAVGHQELRRYILQNCVIHDLHLCPTSLFKDQNADVRTCLLVLEKRKMVRVLFVLVTG
ncbi:N-6 DNA methylase [Paeniroseomonas aquatica]|uniref:N-6 DNA methylase n=1 Tax=Paeniroseomonas aquatica TaxID=373043 RepID=UPI00361540D5